MAGSFTLVCSVCVVVLVISGSCGLSSGQEENNTVLLSVSDSGLDGVQQDGFNNDDTSLDRSKRQTRRTYTRRVSSTSTGGSNDKLNLAWASAFGKNKNDNSGASRVITRVSKSRVAGSGATGTGSGTRYTRRRGDVISTAGSRRTVAGRDNDAIVIGNNDPSDPIVIGGGSPRREESRSTYSTSRRDGSSNPQTFSTGTGTSVSEERRASVRRVDRDGPKEYLVRERYTKEFNLQPIDAFLRQCSDCFTHVSDNVCPMNELALNMRTWAYELGDLLTHGCSRKDCDNKCCPSDIPPVSTLVDQMTNMVKNTYHLIRQYCTDCAEPLAGVLGSKGILGMKWSKWTPFCPCSCRTGLEMRARKCLFNDTEVPVARCVGSIRGSPRDGRYCDVRKTCPVCVSNCRGMEDGKYPACSSCSDYVECEGGFAHRFHCKKGTEFDAFIRRCVLPPSPSCPLVDAPHSCQGLPDGNYHAENRCDAYIQCKRGVQRDMDCPPRQEYNHHARKCEAGHSPTCVRYILDGLKTSRDQGGNVAGMLQDAPGSQYQSSYHDMSSHHNHEESLAPDDMYYDNLHGLSPDERRQMYALGVDQAEFKYMQASMTKEQIMKYVREVEDEREEEYDAIMEEELEEEEEEDEEEEDDIYDRMVNDDDRTFKSSTRSRRGQPLCQSSCDGLVPGKYPACKGCRRYIVCKQDGGMRKRKCPKGEEFDAVEGQCFVGRSETCLETLLE